MKCKRRIAIFALLIAVSLVLLFQTAWNMVSTG